MYRSLRIILRAFFVWYSYKPIKVEPLVTSRRYNKLKDKNIVKYILVAITHKMQHGNGICYSTVH